jgi:hypothetical protein
MLTLQYEGAPPLTIPSPEYTRDLEEVFKIGGKNSSERTAYDDDTPNFWANGNSERHNWGGGGQGSVAFLPVASRTAHTPACTVCS